MSSKGSRKFRNAYGSGNGSHHHLWSLAHGADRAAAIINTQGFAVHFATKGKDPRFEKSVRTTFRRVKRCRNGGDPRQCGRAEAHAKHHAMAKKQTEEACPCPWPSMPTLRFKLRFSRSQPRPRCLTCTRRAKPSRTSSRIQSRD